jgi:hypothetical protein
MANLVMRGVRELEAQGKIRKILDERLAGVPKAAKRGIANARGLSTAGRIFVEEAMKLGFVIDTSHMSEKSTNGALCLAERHDYPLMAGHGGFRETQFGTWRAEKCVTLPFVGKQCLNAGGYFDKPKYNTDLAWTEETMHELGTGNAESLAAERSLSAEQIRRIRDLGGLVGVGTGAGASPRAWNGIAPDCDGSTKDWVQHYQYAVEKMKEKDGIARGVALGTDFNGFVAMQGPRFGPYACATNQGDKVRGRFVVEQAKRQRNGVRYEPLAGGKEVLAWVPPRLSGTSSLETLPAAGDGFGEFIRDLVAEVAHDARSPRRTVVEDYQSIWAAVARFKAGEAATSHWGCGIGGRGVDRAILSRGRAASAATPTPTPSLPGTSS